MKKINKQSGIAPIIIILIVLAVIGVGGGAVYVATKNEATVINSPSPTPMESSTMLDTDVDLNADIDADLKAETGINTGVGADVKEFTMTSWYEMKDGKPSAHFSLPRINVKKGDKVRIKVTNINGMHDFNIDEFGIKKDTPLNQQVVIEFTADKAGSFKYYCAMPGHRQMGQEGTLNVTE